MIVTLILFTSVSCTRTAPSLTRQEHKLLHAGGPPQLLAQQRQQQPRAPALQQQRQDYHCCPGHLARRQERDLKARLHPYACKEGTCWTKSAGSCAQDGRAALSMAETAPACGQHFAFVRSAALTQLPGDFGLGVTACQHRLIDSPRHCAGARNVLCIPSRASFLVQDMAF